MNMFPNFFADNLFDGLFNSLAAPQPRSGKRPGAFRMGNMMKTDVKENDSSFDIDIELPGFKKEDVKAKLKDGYLTIQAERKEDTEDKEEGKYIRRERYCGSCSRSFYVGEEVTQEDIKAKFEDGILKLMVPKIEKKPEIEEDKYISIEG